MCSRLITIIYNKLKNDVPAVGLTEGYIFRDGSIPFAILFDAISHRGAVTANMAGSSNRSDVVAVVTASLRQPSGHLERTNRTDGLDKGNRLEHSIGSLLSLQPTSFVFILTLDSGSLYSRPL